MRNFLQTLAHDERGVTAVEYGILAAIVIGVLVGAGMAFQTELGLLWDAVTGGMETARGGGETPP